MPTIPSLVVAGLQDPVNPQDPPLTSEQFQAAIMQSMGVGAPVETPPGPLPPLTNERIMNNPLIQGLFAPAPQMGQQGSFVQDAQSALPQDPWHMIAQTGQTLLRSSRAIDVVLATAINRLEGMEAAAGDGLLSAPLHALRATAQWIMETGAAGREWVLNRRETVRGSVDVGLSTAITGAFKGLTYGVQHLPGIGNSLQMYLAPATQALEEEASLAIKEVSDAIDTAAGEALFVSVPKYGGAITGTLTGAYTQFVPFMRAGQYLMGIPGALRSVRDGAGMYTALQANRSRFIGDIAGAALLGGLTGEPGPVSHLMASGAEYAGMMGSTSAGFFKDFSPPPETASWREKAWYDVSKRSWGAFSMAAEGFVFSAVLHHVGQDAFTDVPYFRRLWAEKFNRELRGKTTDAAGWAAIRQARLVQDPGLRRFLTINDPDDARIVVELQAQSEILQNSADAMEVLARQQSVEGIVSYQSSVAAMAAGAYELGVKGTANMGVLRNLPDPYRLLQEVNERATALSSVRSTAVIRERPVPLVHSPEDFVGDNILGYVSNPVSKTPFTDVSRAVDPEVPLFLDHRPNLAAAERGVTQELIVNPGKLKSFPSWGELLSQYGGDPNRAWTQLRRQGFDTVVVERAGGMEPLSVILNPRQIQSTRTVTPEAILAAKPKKQTVADMMIRENLNEPLEVSLHRILPDFQFSAPIKNQWGSYDLVMWRRGSPGPSGKQLAQLKKFQWFEGQKVLYGGSGAWEVAAVKPKTLDLIDPVSGSVKQGISPSNVQDLHAAFAAPITVDDALYREFVGFMDEQMTRVSAMKLGPERLRQIAKASQNPGKLERDMVQGSADLILYPSEELFSASRYGVLQSRAQQVQQQIITMSADPANARQLEPLIQEMGFIQNRLKGLARMAQNEEKLINDIDVDTATVMVPDEIDYFGAIFKNFAQSKAIDIPNVGVYETMKLSYARRFARETYEALPPADRSRLEAVRDELVQAIESIHPDDIVSQARLRGYNVQTFKDGKGYMLERVGSPYYEGVYTTEAGLRAALGAAGRHTATPNMTPQFDWFPVSMPLGSDMGGVPGMIPSDLLVSKAGEPLTKEMIRVMARDVQDIVPTEWSKGKAAWGLLFEKRSGLPIWTQYLSPLFESRTQAANASWAVAEPMVNAFEGLTGDARRKIGQFLMGIQDKATFIDQPKLLAAAKAFGLDKKQLHALGAMRRMADDLFAEGIMRFGFEPEDYIYNYFTQIRPTNQSGAFLDNPQGLYKNLPKNYNRFMSKYSREGRNTLANLEDDPLVVMLKYVNTFFFESHVAPHYERLHQLTHMSMKDLPEHTLKDVRAAMRTDVRNKMDADIAAGNPVRALPDEVYAPLNGILEHFLGYPNGSNKLVLGVVKSIASRLGIKMEDKVASRIFDQLILNHYGATLAFRPIPVVRQTVQNLTSSYIRYGATATGQGYNVFNDPKFIIEALDRGIVPMSSKGIRFGEIDIANIMEDMPIETTGISGAVFGGLTRWAALDGAGARFTRALADKGLAGIGNTDHAQRLIAAKIQDAYIRPLVQRYLNDKMTRDELRREGLRYWEDSIQDRFFHFLDTDGSEAAIWYLNKEAVTVTQYIYGMGAQPGMLQSPLGRMFYMYGTFGLWYKDFVLRTASGSRTWGERAGALTRALTVAGALSAVGWEYGVDMSSWLSHNAFGRYGGGPAVGAARALADFGRADYGAKTAVLQRYLANESANFFFPGKLLIGDAMAATEELPYPQRAMTRFLLGRSTNDIRPWHLDLMRMQSQMMGGGESQAAPTTGLPVLPQIPQAPGQ